MQETVKGRTARISIIVRSVFSSWLWVASLANIEKQRGPEWSIWRGLLRGKGDSGVGSGWLETSS